MQHHWRAGVVQRVDGEIRMEDERVLRVLEHAAVAGIEITFGAELFGEQNGVLVEFDVEVADAIDGFLHQGRAVDQQLGVGQYAIPEDRVVRA